MVRPNGQEPHRIAEPLPDAARPLLKFQPGPLEAMVGMAELCGQERLPGHVVLPVWRRQHDGPRPGELEQHPLKGRQPGWVQMLDDLDHGSGIELLQPLVPVQQRSVDQFDAIRLGQRQAVQLQPTLACFKRSDRDIQADDLLELLVLEQFPKQ